MTSDTGFAKRSEFLRHVERFAWFAQDDLGIWTADNGARVAWFKDPDGNMLSVAQL